MATALELRYAGCANGAPVTLFGKGQIDVGKREHGLQLTLDVPPSPLHWDHALAVLGLCCAPLVNADEDSPVLVQSRSHLWDENGREMGSWAESAVVKSVGGGLRWRVQLLRCDVRLEAIERLRTVETCHLQAMPTGEEWTAVTSTWSFMSGLGNRYRGVTVAMIDRQLGEYGLLRARSVGVARLPVVDVGGETVMVEAIFARDARRERKR